MKRNIRNYMMGNFHCSTNRIPRGLPRGYSFAGLLYDKVNSNAPFYFGSIMALIATILMIIFTVLDKKKEKINVA